MEKLNKIISGGYCIGCGLCAYTAPEKVRMEFDRFGMLQPEGIADLDDEQVSAILQVCPFSDASRNEDEHAARLYPDTKRDERFGHYAYLFAGHVAEGEFRGRGSSGGMVSWILAELLEKNLVDGVIHMKSSKENESDALFLYSVSSSVEEVLDGAKSKYYPMEMSEVLARIKESNKRYALVGVPCFIKAARNLMEIDPVVAERIRFCLGLVCGHLKSKAFADCFGWQAGIQPGRLEGIDFRVKFPDGKASHYGVEVSGEGKNVTRVSRELFGSNWGLGFFKYSACEYCDDVFAETADVSIGDAWLPQYLNDCQGSSVVVIRSEELGQLIRGGIESGRLALKDCSVDDMAESQAGGLRHRRDGLSYRLFLKHEEGKWAPQKRVQVTNGTVDRRRKKIYQLRETLRIQSHDLWIESVNKNDFSVFQTGMQKTIRQYKKLYHPMQQRITEKIKRVLGKIIH